MDLRRPLLLRRGDCTFLCCVDGMGITVERRAVILQAVRMGRGGWIAGFEGQWQYLGWFRQNQKVRLIECMSMFVKDGDYRRRRLWRRRVGGWGLEFLGFLLRYRIGLCRLVGLET